MKHIILALAIAAGASACGGMSGPDDLGSVLDEIRVENHTHLITSERAGTPADLAREMRRHEGRMGQMMERMETMMGGMAQCPTEGMHGMREVHDRMMGEEMEHDRMMEMMDGRGMGSGGMGGMDGMGGIGGMGDAMGELHRHHDAMETMLEGMHGMAEGMGMHGCTGGSGGM